MRLTHLIILGSLATSASATEYVFQDFFVLKHPTGVAWNNTQLDVKLVLHSVILITAFYLQSDLILDTLA